MTGGQAAGHNSLFSETANFNAREKSITKKASAANEVLTEGGNYTDVLNEGHQ